MRLRSLFYGMRKSVLICIQVVICGVFTYIGFPFIKLVYILCLSWYLRKDTEGLTSEIGLFSCLVFETFFLCFFILYIYILCAPLSFCECVILIVYCSIVLVVWYNSLCYDKYNKCFSIYISDNRLYLIVVFSKDYPIFNKLHAFSS